MLTYIFESQTPNPPLISTQEQELQGLCQDENYPETEQEQLVVGGQHDGGQADKDHHNQAGHKKTGYGRIAGLILVFLRILLINQAIIMEVKTIQIMFICKLRWVWGDIYKMMTDENNQYSLL